MGLKRTILILISLLFVLAAIFIIVKKGLSTGNLLPLLFFGTCLLVFVFEDQLFEWINSIQTNLVEKKDIDVDLCDENGDTLFRWKVLDAFPTSLEAPTFDAASNDAAIESMTLLADRIRVEEI